jgi:DNA-binding LacI/PurR family transcriptional regulator
MNRETTVVKACARTQPGLRENQSGRGGGGMVTMKDVARAAGVSQPAVSYAFNRPDQLSTEVREHILQVASDLNYAGPDPVGRGLRRGSVGAIGLMITDSLRGVAEVGEMSEVMLTLLPLRSAAEAEDPAAVEAGQARMSGASLVDGFIVYSLPDGHRAVDAALARGLPTVVVDAPSGLGGSYLGIEDRLAARQAAEHLIGLGPPTRAAGAPATAWPGSACSATSRRCGRPG